MELFTYAQNTVLANKLDLFISNRSLRIPIAIRPEVAQISYMTFLVTWRAMGFGEWVDCWRMVSSNGAPC